MTEIVQVDAFTDRPFSGNPAAVVLLDRASDDADWMQALARETGLPATAFIDPSFGLRWFSPTTELALCGHGTLATAHVLFERGAAGPLRFTTRYAGELVASRVDGLIALDFPSVVTQAAEVPDALRQALGVPMVNVERGEYDYLVELASEEQVARVAPDFGVLRQVDTRGVIVTARATEAAGDFVSRFFAPRAGMDEDSVTGSAHCALGPYWAAKMGKSSLVGVQVSARRGVVHVEVGGGGRLTLLGQAVTVMRGRLTGGPVDDWYAAQSRVVATFATAELERTEPALVSIPGPRGR